MDRAESPIISRVHLASLFRHDGVPVFMLQLGVAFGRAKTPGRESISDQRFIDYFGSSPDASGIGP